MKKTLKRFCALLIVCSMLFPQGALGSLFYTGTYDLKVTFEDDQDPPVRFEEYLWEQPGSAKVIELMQQLVVSNYNRTYYADRLPEGKKDANFFEFASPAMQDLMDLGLDYYAQGEEGWAIYAEQVFASPYDETLQTKFRDFNSTIVDYGVGTHIITHYNDVVGDAKLGVTYTLTFEITDHTIDVPDVQPEEPENPIVIAPDKTVEEGVEENPTIGVLRDGGTVKVSTENAKTGDPVTVTATPNETKMVNYVVVRDKDGKKVELTYDGQGQYTFEMPEGGVTVTATFRTEPAKPDETGVGALLDTSGHTHFMIGDDRGLFEPNDNIDRSEVSMIFYRLLRNKDVKLTQKFNDVPEDSWYAVAVRTLASLGILKGVGGGYFQPKRAITRAEFATICTRFATKTVKGHGFDDTKGHWAEDAISMAVGFGWIYGYEDGSFQPDRPITRQEAAAIVNRLLYRLADQIAIDRGERRDFPDVDDTMWGWYEIAEATYGHDHDEEEGFAHEFWFENERLHG